MAVTTAPRRSRRRAIARRRAAVAAACAVALAAVMLGAPVSALAHAVLSHTTPHQNSAVAKAPTLVQLDFNEPVEVSAGAVRVFDGEGDRVDAGSVRHPEGTQRSVAVDVRDGLGDGVYTATYRVVSADGHPVSGGFSFTVGDAALPASGGVAVADLLEDYEAGPAVEGVYGVVRGIHYAALLLLIGVLVFAAVVWPPGVERRWPARLLFGAVLAGAAAALAGFVLQGSLVAGASLGEALRSDAIAAAGSTRVGDAWLIRAGAWAVLIVLLAVLPSRPSRVTVAALAGPVLAIVASLPLAGHADTHSPRGVLIPADVLHAIAAGVWLGGLIVLITLFWPRRSGAPSPGAAQATARFSRLALPAIVVLVAVGSVQAWFYLGSVGELVSSTYGWALLAKIALLAGVVALASGNRRRAAALATAGEEQSAPALRRSMLGEVTLAALVLAATATLVRAAPPVSENAGPVVRELNVGPLRLQLDIEPATTGPNDYHLYFFDRRTGAQVDRVKEVTVRLVQPEKGIGPIRLSIPRRGPAHYELLDQALGVKGEWRTEIDVRVSEFDQYTARTTFDVR